MMQRQMRLRGNASPTWRETSGMTLLELTLAAGIMAVGFVLLSGSIISIFATNQGTEHRQVAMSEASKILEQLNAMSFEEIISMTNPILTTLGSGASVTMECFDGSDWLLLPLTDTENAEEALPNPLEVRCSINFEVTGGNAMNLSSSALFRR